MAAGKSAALLKVITRIPMFSKVGEENAARILKLCEFRSAEAGELVCKFNEPSDDFSILLSGQLAVFDRRDLQIADISPVASVGEMGLFTGQPRSATVRVVEKSTLLVLKKVTFERLTRQNPAICREVYSSVLYTLHCRVVDSVVQQSNVNLELKQLEDQIEAVKAETASMHGE